MTTEYRCTDEELERDALSVTAMEDGQRIIVLPDDHPAMVARAARFKAEAQGRRDALRIDANHWFGGDFTAGERTPYLDGQPVADVTQCYVGEVGWLIRYVRDGNGNIIMIGGDVRTERLTGRVELREKSIPSRGDMPTA